MRDLGDSCRPIQESRGILDRRAMFERSTQVPGDFLSVFRRAALFGMDHRQGQRGIAFLLSDRRLDRKRLAEAGIVAAGPEEAVVSLYPIHL